MTPAEQSALESGKWRDKYASLRQQVEDQAKEIGRLREENARIGEDLRCTTMDRDSWAKQSREHNIERIRLVAEISALREDRRKLLGFVEAYVSGDVVAEEDALSLIAPVLDAARAKERGEA